MRNNYRNEAEFNAGVDSEPRMIDMRPAPVRESKSRFLDWLLWASFAATLVCVVWHFV